MIRAVIFDWFGVCTLENWADVLGRELGSKLNLSDSFVKEKLKPLIQPFARAEWTSEQFLERFIGSLNSTKNPAKFEYIFEKIPEVNFELLDYVSKLRSEYSTFLLSNNFGKVFPNYEKKLNFDKYFDKLFLSHKLKMSKTQKGIWNKVLSEIDFDPSELVFVDNKESYLEPAKKLGIKTVLFSNNEQVKIDLAKLGVRLTSY